MIKKLYYKFFRILLQKKYFKKNQKSLHFTIKIYLTSGHAIQNDLAKLEKLSSLFNFLISDFIPVKNRNKHQQENKGSVKIIPV